MIGTKALGLLAQLATACALLAPAHARAQAQVTDPPAGRTATADAADTRLDLAEIVVTARRVAENLQNVPVAITAVSAETLREQQIVEVTALQRVTPSFTVTKSTRGSTSPAIMIRGQRGFSVNTLNDPAVTVYFAEVGQSIAGGTNASLYDLQSVQVLKGPQGTLFGRNTTGGAVLLTPNAPTDAFEGYVQVAGGNYAYNDYEGVLNVPVTEALAIRAAGKVTRRDGYLENPTRGGDEAENLHSSSGRLSVRWNGDAVENTTIATYYKDDLQNGRKLYLVDPTRVLPAPPLRAAQAALLQAGLQRVDALGEYEYEDIAPQYARTRIYGLQNTTQIDLGSNLGLDELAVKNIAGYRNIRTEFFLDLDGSTVETITQPGLTTAKVYSDELQLLGKTGNFDFVGGLFYYQLKAEDFSQSAQFGDLRQLAPAIFPLHSALDFDTRNKSSAAFVHANYKLDAVLEGLSISAGARITKDIRGVTYHNRTANGLNPTAFRCTMTGVTGLPNDRSLCSVRADDVDFTEPTYDLSLNYQANADLLFYAAFRHGYRAGGFNNSPPTRELIPAFVFDPETVDDLEIGVKSSFMLGGMAGRFNLAAYHDSYDDAQRATNTLIPGTTTFTAITINAAKGQVEGMEAELTLNPIDALTLTLNGSLIDAKYDRWTDTYQVNGVATPIDISGSHFAYVPETQFNASVKYELPVNAALGELSLGASYYYQSEIETAEINTRNCGPDGLYSHCNAYLGALPSFGIANVRFDWRDVVGKGFDVALFVNNVTDKFYRADAANALGSIGFASHTIGEPRMFGAEVRVSFGAAK